ncbi:Rrf2 family transcriptional regulator [bacterium]|nr:Rrf2 family transcriptional regulator [candidate division CSSED10-310 bacterium]
MKFLAMTDALTLAIHTIELMSRDPSHRWTTRQIAHQFAASEHHLAKIHTRLVKSGLLHSVRGPKGGLILAKDPATIYLIDIFNVIEGPFQPSKCLFGQPVCHRTTCLFGSLIQDIDERVRTYLCSMTVADLLEPADQCRISE